jgi:hypothetical protein
MSYDYTTALARLQDKAQDVERLRSSVLQGHTSATSSRLGFISKHRSAVAAVAFLYLGATTGIVYSAYASQQLKVRSSRVHAA